MLFTSRLVPSLPLAIVLTCCSLIVAAEPGHSTATQPASVSAAVSQPAGQAAIAVDAAEFDFGRVRAGEKVEHRFRISNTGSAELKIEKVKPNCGCTIAGEYPRTLAPGASGEIPLSLSTANINGTFKKTAIVFSNDPARPQLTLTLKGEARPLIALQPAGAYLGSVYGEQPQTKTVVITNNMGTPLKLALDPLTSKNGWTFELAESQAGKKYELKATFNPKGFKPGQVRHTAVLLTNVETQHQIEVVANAVVRDRIEADPASLTIAAPASQPAYVPAALQGSAPRRAQTVTTPRIVKVENYGEKPIKVTEAFPDKPAIKVDLKEQVAGKNYLISVTIPPAYTPEAWEGITIRTDDPEKPVIRIPIVAAQPTAPSQRPGATGPGTGWLAAGSGDGQKPQQAAADPRPVDQMVGKDAPAFTLTTLDGKTVSKQSLSGTVTVLDFFAPNCGFCKKQMPRVEALRKTYEAKGVKFLFVGETMGRTPTTADDVTAKLKELGVSPPAAVDAENAVGKLFNVNSYPRMFVLGKGGKVEAVISGNIQDLEARLISQLDSLLTK